MLGRLLWRVMTELDTRIALKAAWLWVAKGFLAVQAYRRRLRRKQLYPPFMFIALTNICNLRCHGCWVEKEGKAHFLRPEDIDRIIESGKRAHAYYYTLLGGEPFLYKGLLDIFRRHPDCYFQVITNGMFFSEATVRELKQLGNVTPLVSLDGFAANNDRRRGAGVYEAVMEGLARLQRYRLLYGIATTLTRDNLEECLSDAYLEEFIRRGAMYIWYYVYRPVGADPHPEYALTRDQLLQARRRMLALRRKHPILIVDSYWTADGEAFCPAAMGLGFHIGPQGSIEPCPPLSVACETVRDGQGDLFPVINESRFLRGFQEFVRQRTKGCVILEYPQELVQFFREHGARDYSGRDIFAELAALTPRHSQHLPGEEIPEDFWVYRLLKRNVFFGMGAL
ncbi:MAG: radical SAM protein [Gemmatales bacterium]|nr:radical SAM protein [Gemmatales bacterium]MDW7995722.1 radical SAM protein [Gemmatales bacterium]